MGQRHQYLVTFPEQSYPDFGGNANPNNSPAATQIIHHQWLYGVNAIMTAHRVLKLITRNAGEHDFIFGTDDNGGRLKGDGEAAIAAAISVEPETGYFHRVHIEKQVVPQELDGGMHLDNNDGVTVIQIVKGSNRPLFCFASPYGVEGSHYKPSMGNGPWTAAEYLSMYYTIDELKEKFSVEELSALAVALREIQEFSEPMNNAHLGMLHPNLRDRSASEEVIKLPLRNVKTLPAAPAKLKGARDIDGAQVVLERGKVEILYSGVHNVWKVGDVAVYGGYNLTYMGKVVSIAAKTVTVQEDGKDGKKHRMSIEKFSTWNRRFNLEEITKRNSEWTD